MGNWFRTNFCVEITGRWCLQMLASLLLPAAILAAQPLGMNFSQSATVAGMLLVITWWTIGVVKKVPASLFLLVWFCLFSGAPTEVIFTFPLGETFVMLIVTYLFSQAISSCGLVDRVLLPLLIRFARTPFRCILAVIATLFLTMYVVPQPLARLLLVAMLIDKFLRYTTLPTATREVILYAVFAFFAVVNMACKDGDLIMHYAACSASGVDISNWDWTRAMAIPSLVYVAVVLAVFVVLFRRELKDVRVELLPTAEALPKGFTRQELPAVVIIVATILLWMTSGLWADGFLLFGFLSASTLITLVSTVLLFLLGVLHKRDFACIDVVTLVFLSAAMAIGGVLKACGAADILFGQLSSILPKTFSVGYLLVMMLIGMLLHMFLGSNTTTLSVVVPGLILLCGGVVSPELVVYISIVSIAFHAILPFHSVALMIGASSGYFPARCITRLGLAITPFVFLTAICVYLPYWSFIGLI